MNAFFEKFASENKVYTAKDGTKRIYINATELLDDCSKAESRKTIIIAEFSDGTVSAAFDGGSNAGQKARIARAIAKLQKEEETKAEEAKTEISENNSEISENNSEISENNSEISENHSIRSTEDGVIEIDECELNPRGTKKEVLDNFQKWGGVLKIWNGSAWTFGDNADWRHAQFIQLIDAEGGGEHWRSPKLSGEDYAHFTLMMAAEMQKKRQTVTLP